MTIFGLCEKGKYRKENQDSILMCSKESSGLFIVADGVGGSVNGAEASRRIVEAYGRWWEEVFLEIQDEAFCSLFDYIKSLAEQINRDLCRQYGAGNCCSTIALLFIHRGVYGYLSAGDSRIYHCSRGKAKQITRDDVWENCPGANADSKHAGKIISAVGGFDDLEYSCATDRVHFGDVFMLCSDGIYKYVKQEFLTDRLRRIYRSFTLKEEAVKELAREAVENETKDNYSLIVLKMGVSKA